MKLIGSLFVILLLTHCKTPGLEEPDVVTCSIVEENRAECFNKDGDSVGWFYTIDMIGFQCVSPADYAKIKTHHEVLHRELNKKKTP